MTHITIEKEKLEKVLEALELSAVTVDSFGVQKKTQEAHAICKQALAAPTVQEQIAGFDVVLDESLPPNTMKFVQPGPVQEAVACKTLCELCMKRGYGFCANTAKTTPIITTPPAQPAPLPTLVTEEMHIAAVKVLHRANGVDGLPQRMLDAMLAAQSAQPSPIHKGYVPISDDLESVFIEGCGEIPLAWPPAEQQDVQEKCRIEVVPAKGGLLPSAPVPLNPMQPLVDVNGVTRFKKNGLVDALYEHGVKTGLGLNELHCMKFSDEDRMQFAQLIGCSLSGYGDLSYVSDASYDAAQQAAAQPAAPEGWKLVPVELTDEMWKATDYAESADEAWKLMLDAAPKKGRP
jgi:hypothetical protein